MLAKLTSKNQITIPREVLSKVPKVQYFDVENRDGTIVLNPVQVINTDLQKIREKIKGMGLTESCVKEAVRWARSK